MPDGSPLPTGGKDGRQFGFHDLRRSFATCNSENRELFQLKLLIQHRSLDTTQIDVAMTQCLNQPVQTLFVPKRPAAEAG